VTKKVVLELSTLLLILDNYLTKQQQRLLLESWENKHLTKNYGKVRQDENL